MNADSTYGLPFAICVAIRWGGFNAAQLLYRYPQLFRRIALTCPMIPVLAPRPTKDSLDRYLSAAPATIAGWVSGALTWLQWEFPNDSQWVEHDVLRLPVTAAMQSVRVAITCGDHDQYGYQIGSRQLADRLNSFHVATTWTLIEGGGHCASDSRALARFFLAD